LISGPRQRATLSIEHHWARTSSSLTFFYSFPTYSDPYQTRTRRPFQERVRFDDLFIDSSFSFENSLFLSHFLLTTRSTRLLRVFHHLRLPST
jgi:hypothetical protein